MRIKKNTNGNDYIEVGQHFVRDFTKYGVTPIDINNFVTQSDYGRLIENETKNYQLRLQHVDSEKIDYRDIVILSDGYDFKEKHRLLSLLPPHVAILATNGALSRWELVGPRCPEKEKRRINQYIVNNPFQECLSFLPRQSKYYPSCIASSRTHPEFTRIYKQKGTLLQYGPVPSAGFKGVTKDGIYAIDDYRNPICAAIGLAYRFGADRVVLYCCDETFADERPGSVPVGDLFEYPQHTMARDLIDANLYWLTHQIESDVTVRHCSGAGEYENASYIEAGKLPDFFK